MSENIEGKYSRIAQRVVSAMEVAGVLITDDDQRLQASGIYKNWKAGSYAVGDVRNANGQTWECHQAHDNAVYPDITPGSSAWPTFWRPLHGKSAQTARPWVKPENGTTDTYKAGECMIWTDGRTLRAKRETNFSPDEYAADWEEVTE